MADYLSSRLSSGAKKFLLSLVAVSCLCLASYGASAAPVAGCDPKVEKAMQAAAQARVAADVAVTEEIISMPDSVLTMTCFDDAAGVSAKVGGAIFSGDFTSDIEIIIEDALQEFDSQFEDAAGYDTGKVSYDDTDMTGTFDCTEMNDLWDAAIEDDGVETSIPISLSLDDLMAGASSSFDVSKLFGDAILSLPIPPSIIKIIAGLLGFGTGGTNDFLTNWSKSSSIFSALNTAMSALSPPSIIPYTDSATTSCAVLMAYGVVSSCP